MGPHGGRTMTVTTIVDRSMKSHRVENLIHWPYSLNFAATTATHHVAMIYRPGGREEVTDSVWRLPRRRLRSRPPWLVGAFSLANLPRKNTLTTTQQHLSMRRDLNGRQRPPWCPPHTWCRRIKQSPRMLADCHMRRCRE